MNIEKLNFQFDKEFQIGKEYLASLPDLQFGEIKGSKTKISKVGISNFHLPLKLKTKDGNEQELECSIVGTVSLEALKKGINMSRILRVFYERKDQTFDIGLLCDILSDYKKKLETFEAHILCSFRYKVWQESLRSLKDDGTKNGGWQFYNVTFEVNYYNRLEKVIHLDFVYSSACPCSTELSLHAIEKRDQFGIPHSQRSVMRISIKADELIWIEDIIKYAQDALVTETLVFCKREDEQAFAELNAGNTKFVEDAVRLMYERLELEKNIQDFKLIASHNESLHSHDAIAVMIGGNGYFNDNISIADLKSLIY